ncbi:hypothetical protein EIP86_008898 [Pleurotus ostreatoroseus]|nr:hypothetical protein EIP86_008898 [Pleurotus ostreatoroseus]
MRGPAYELEDPLTRALAPPPDETVEEREVRLNKEAEAQRVSDLIDESLRAERASWKKRKVMKVLLLGQSESGEYLHARQPRLKVSVPPILTIRVWTQRLPVRIIDMQLAFAPKAWAVERISWRAVIQLNLVRSVNIILDALAARLSPPSPHPPTSPNVSYYGSPPSSPLTDEGPFTGLMPMSPDKRNSLLKLKLRLAPLRQVEADLKARLGDGTEEVTESRVGLQPLYASPFDDPPQTVSPRPSKEIIVRSHQSWKNKERERKTKDRASLRQSTMAAVELDRDDVTEVLAGCSDDMVALWDDPVVQDIVDNSDVLKKLGDSGE